MKKLFLIGGICFLTQAIISQEPATKGAITEGLFIIQNKQCEVQEYIQELKKALTECSYTPQSSDKEKKQTLSAIIVP